MILKVELHAVAPACCSVLSWVLQAGLLTLSLICRSVPVQKHLEKVYATLAAALVVAALGVYVQIITGISAGLVGVIGSVICMTWLTAMQPTAYNVNKRSVLHDHRRRSHALSVAAHP